MADDVELPLSNDFLREIGLITTYWSALELQMEFAILHQQQISPSTGLVLTSALGTRAKWDLLAMLNDEGAFEPTTSKRHGTKLLKRVKNAYSRRNEVAHHLWVATNDPLKAKRKSIRSRGRLVLVDQEVHINQLRGIADEIQKTGLAFTEFMEAHHMVPKD